MTETATSTPEVTPAPQAPAESVIIRPWPKVVFLYPTFVCAAIFFLLSWTNLVPSRILGNTFMVVWLINLLIFAFDFSRIWTIVMIIGGALLVVLTLWLDLSEYIGKIAHEMTVECNSQFYGWFSGGMGILLLIVFVNSRFHYYEVNAREILHHHGYLGDVKRWSTEGLEMNKEIYDVAEYALLRSGRLIFSPMTSKKSIVVDNVHNVNRAEKAINDLLSHVAVRINQRPGPG